jgi:tRNA uridine 5-carboxymethylaminomethyl modification enzyme
MLMPAEEVALNERSRAERTVLDAAASTTIDVEAANAVLRSCQEREVLEPQRIQDLARRPRVSLQGLLSAVGFQMSDELSEDVWISAEIELKYEGYLARERQAADRLAELASFRLPPDVAYLELLSLSTEARQKLDRVRPPSLAQAARIPGVSPSDLQNLVLEVVKRRRPAA